MSAAKKCLYCDLFFDDSLDTCPYCGSPNELQQQSAKKLSPQRPDLYHAAMPSPGLIKIRNPWIAAICSLLFLGWGQWYNGKTDDGIKFFGAYVLVAIITMGILAFLFSISFLAMIGVGLIGTLIALGIYAYSIYDAYQTSKRINRREIEFTRKSRLFWLPVAMYLSVGVLLVLVIVIGTISPAITTSGSDESGITVPTTLPTLRYAATGNLADLMITRYDLPSDFALPKSGVIPDAEISSDMTRFGAIKGYKGIYPKNPTDEDLFWVGHYVVQFPSGKAIDMVKADADKYKSVKSPGKSETLTCPPIGDSCIANRQTGRNPGATEDHYHLIISFSKGDIYETFWTVGPDPDYNMLKDLAVKADAKIP